MSGAAPDDDRGTVFQEVTYEGPSSRYNGTQKRALVTHDWHYLDNRIPDGTREFYRRGDDPLEEHDRAGLGEPTEPALGAELAAWMDQIALPPALAGNAAANLSERPFSPAQPRGDVFGGWLTLDGVDAPATVRATDSFEVKVYWHATQRPPEGWRLFTHVVAPGRMLNLDHEPAGGTLPLARLRPGQYVRDVLRVSLPAGWPPGPLTVRVGVWRGNERAPVSGAHAAPDGAAEAARVTVQP
jgi:hypothetical protein